MYLVVVFSAPKIRTYYRIRRYRRQGRDVKQATKRQSFVLQQAAADEASDRRNALLSASMRAGELGARLDLLKRRRAAARGAVEDARRDAAGAVGLALGAAQEQHAAALREKSGDIAALKLQQTWRLYKGRKAGEHAVLDATAKLRRDVAEERRKSQRASLGALFLHFFSLSRFCTPSFPVCPGYLPFHVVTPVRSRFPIPVFVPGMSRCTARDDAWAEFADVARAFHDAPGHVRPTGTTPTFRFRSEPKEPFSPIATLC